MTLPQCQRALEWLAAAAKDPRACRDDWTQGLSGVHLLATGRLWDVLTVPERLGLYATDVLNSISVAERGPVLHDGRGRRVGFLVPSDPTALWAGHDLRYVSKGGWIAAPAPHCRWGTLHWLVPPDGSGALTPPELLELALEQALREMAHTDGCSRPHPVPCRRTAEPAASPTEYRHPDHCE